MNTKQKIVALILLVVVLAVLGMLSNLKPSDSKNQVTVAPEGSPIVNDLKVLNLSKTSSIVSWKTTLPAKTELYYATSSTALEKMVVKDPGSSTAHSIEVTHLTSGTKYFFTLISTSESGKTMTVEGDFTTSVQ